MPDLLKLRAFGCGWTILVAALLAVIEPTLPRSGGPYLLAGGLFSVAAGWSFLVGRFVHLSAQPPLGDVRFPSADTQLLSETGGTLVHCSQVFCSQFEATRAELSRVQQLFSEAIAKLIESFQAMSDQSRRDVKSAMSHVADVGAGTGQTVAELQHIAEVMERSVGEAVMSLQFQDMVTQLIDHVSRRLDQLHGVLGDIEAASALVQSIGASGFAPQQAERLRAHLDAVRAQLVRLGEHASNNPVRQESFSSGEVELF